MNSEEIVFVELSNAFMISMTEVTQKQYRDVMGTSPWSGKSRVRMGDSFPATWVSWHDAIAFCDRLTAQRHATGDLPDNERFRLPTEAEWEVACRGGSLFAFCYGNDESRLGKYAWFQGNAMQGTEPFAHQVGTKLPNSWGLFDMHGNVLEWCADWHEALYTGGVNPKGPATGSQRACRGGSWGHAASNCRSASRYALPPDERNEFVGFRVVRAPRE
jgi:formylglycine-generating enzyme required for sulfatase activity